MTPWSSSTFLLARPKVPSCALVSKPNIPFIWKAFSSLEASIKVKEETYSLLGELAGALVARVAEKLNDTALIGSEASNLLDNLADKGGTLAEVALCAGNARLDDASSGLL